MSFVFNENVVDLDWYGLVEARDLEDLGWEFGLNEMTGVDATSTHALVHVDISWSKISKFRFSVKIRLASSPNDFNADSEAAGEDDDAVADIITLLNKDRVWNIKDRSCDALDNYIPTFIQV